MLMKIVEVNSPQLAQAFVDINAELNAANPNYIRPIDKEVFAVFDKQKNKLLENGAIQSWLLLNENGKVIGRIAAFYYTTYKNKGTSFPTGCIGFFDCINDQAAANLLFETSKRWLMERGMEAMDGPVNFGDRDKWWGLQVKGNDRPPLYGMSFHPSYYEALFTEYGFENFYNQYYYLKNFADGLPERFKERYEKFKSKQDYSAIHLDKKNLSKFAQDFVTIYNAAWAQHGEAKAITLDQILKLFKELSPIMDEKIIWFAYYKKEPIAMFINIPDINQYYQYFKGKFGLFQQLHLLWMKWNKTNKKIVGLAFGVVPKFQALGVDSFLIYSSFLVIKKINNYEAYEMGWAADWNPKMLNIYKSLGATPSRQMVTYRCIFDKEKHPFERHPLMDYTSQ